MRAEDLSFIISFPLLFHLSFCSFVSCPEGPHSIPLFYQSTLLSLSLSPPSLSLCGCLRLPHLSLSKPPSTHTHTHTHALQKPVSVPQLCRQWELFTTVHHQAAPGAPPHRLTELSQPRHECLATTNNVEYYSAPNKSTTQHAIKQPFPEKWQTPAE